MRVALVHELLTMRGGAERVLRVLAGMFPDAPIYTLLYDEKKLGDWFPKDRVRPSLLQDRVWSLNHHRHLKKFPAAVEAWSFDTKFASRISTQDDNPPFDLVISSSSAFVHGIITNGSPLHLCYVQSPARYLWDRTHEVLERASHGLLGPLKRAYLSRVFHQLRIWDAEVADRPDMLIAASKEVQRRIELYWRRKSDVMYPPIDDFWFAGPGTGRGPVPNPSPVPKSYYLIVSQLAPYKRIDLAIHACNERRLPLKIAGSGPSRRSLEAIAGPTVEFLGYKTDEELRSLYEGARATIFPGEEDFGLVPLESLACGTPVIAYGAGGALETLTAGQTGEFFAAPSTSALHEAVDRLEHARYDRQRLQERAREFSRATFERNITDAVEVLLERKV